METGAFLWKNNATVLNVDVRIEGIATSPAGPLIMADGASNNFVAYDVKTGREIWRAPTGDLPWAMLPAYTFCYNNGVTFMGSYDGYVYAYDITNGKLIWKSDYIGAEDEAIYGNQPFTGASVGADGVLYYSTATIYRLMPRTRFHAIVAINETTGQFLWKLPIGMNPTAVTEGYLVATDAENGMQYCIGKGATSTTVSTTTVGKSILIHGSVLDMSPGAPNTPAISDADMDEWMDYLYGQNATLINSPPMPNGVTVRLAAIDQNGNYIDLGTATSDSSGLYKTMWTPEIDGTYTIYATFDGSNSYWGSYASAALGVERSDNDNSASKYIWVTIGAAIAVIIVVIIATFLLLRKKP
jgi:WD40 repeat protein